MDNIHLEIFDIQYIQRANVNSNWCFSKFWFDTGYYERLEGETFVWLIKS